MKFSQDSDVCWEHKDRIQLVINIKSVPFVAEQQNKRKTHATDMQQLSVPPETSCERDV